MTPAAALHLLEQAERSHKRAHWRLAARALGEVVAQLQPAIDARATSAPVGGDSPTAAAPPAWLPASPPAPAQKPGRAMLCEYLALRGLTDEGGELAGRDLDAWHRGKPFRRKLVREGGLPLERAAQAAFEAGFFPDLTWAQFEPAAVDTMIAAMEREFLADFPRLQGFEPEAWDPELDGALQ